MGLNYRFQRLTKQICFVRTGFQRKIGRVSPPLPAWRTETEGYGLETLLADVSLQVLSDLKVAKSGRQPSQAACVQRCPALQPTHIWPGNIRRRLCSRPCLQELVCAALPSLPPTWDFLFFTALNQKATHGAASRGEAP